MALDTAPRMVWPQRLGWAVLAWLLACALGWLAVPPLVQAQLQQRASTALGRAVTVGAVAFRPWSLQLTLSDIAVAGLDGAPAQLKVAQVQGNLELASLLRMAPVLDSLTIDAPQLRLQHLGNGRYDVDDVLARLRGAPDAAASPPFTYALYNIQVRNGALDFADQQPLGRREHQVRKLTLDIPFLSNLDYRRSVVVKPQLAFELDGSAFDSALQGTPFEATGQMDLQLRVQRFDLKLWLAYLPADLPVKPGAGVLDADLQLAFVQSPKVSLSVSGRLGARGLTLVDASGAEVFKSPVVNAVLADTRPLERLLALDTLTIATPQLRWVNRRSARLQLDLLNATAPGRAAPAAKTAVPEQPWRASLRALQISQAQAQWTDENFRPAAQLALADLDLSANDLSWPLAAKPYTVKASLKLPHKSGAGSLALRGSGNASSGTVHAELQHGALALAAPWLGAYLAPALSGSLDTALDATWQDEKMQVTLAQLALTDLALTTTSPPPADATRSRARSGPSSGDMPRLQRLELDQARIDWSARSAQLGTLRLQKPTSGVRRDEDGRWMFASWLKPQAGAEEGSPQAKPWQFGLAGLVVTDGALVYADRSTARPVRMELTGLQLQTGAWRSNGPQPTAVTLATRVRAGQTEPGSLRFAGDALLQPLQLRGQLDAKDFPAHALAPYLSDRLNLDVLRADASLKAQLQLADRPDGMQLTLRGDAALEDFRANNAIAGTGNARDLVLGEELLSWKALSAPGLALDIVPGKPTRVQLREATLTDFFARIVVSPEGRINLQDLLKPIEPTASAATAPAQISMGPLSLVNGRVLFSDLFVKPNYSADLSALVGRLGAFATQSVGAPVVLAPLELRGRAEGTAALEIVGQINPLADPLALDVRGKVSDLELPPLSPYAIKYAGYGIERGKLSMDARYQIDASGQLVASNQLVLHALQFGDAVPGAENSLPVKLATALLADADGVITLDVPISGSLNDPQFSVGPVVWKIIRNIVARALTAPFSLLGGGGGGAEDGGRIVFAPGSSVLSPQAMQTLDKAAQALLAKTQLRITVTGHANLDAERDGLKRALLAQQLLAEKRRRLAGDAQAASSASTVSDEEAPALLKAVYRRAEINKPRNVLGFTRDLAPQEMEALLLASIPVDADAMRALAQARSLVVKDYLAAKKFPPERLFLGAARVTREPPAGNAPYQPVAELSLTQH